MPTVTTTYLEILSPVPIRPKHCDDARFSIHECTVKQWQFNRFLYFAVGESWTWNDKRGWSAEQWRAYAESDTLRTFAAYYDGSPAGYFELHEDDVGEIEIAYLGLLPAFYGRGFGGALLTRALEEAWKSQPRRVWVHTCTDDHSAALPNYLARGMTIYKTETLETPSPANDVIRNP
ncbi:MAG: GNAT family N-acetyltransferase [Pedosphaera sp.]|nr:GNAT family N-acetyltransferase [Pedosphaera sp.]